MKRADRRNIGQPFSVKVGHDPCNRTWFLPLYHEMKIYEESEDYSNACMIAKRIVNKPIKIQKSGSVKRIIYEAEEVISSYSQLDEKKLSL